MGELPEVKKKLYRQALEVLNNNIECIKFALRELMESAGSEAKSSAGDKHETGRAMVHLEQEKMSKQLANSIYIQKVMDRIDPAVSLFTVSLGSLVITDKVRFFVSAALGKIKIGEYDYYLVSITSPLAKNFIGKKKGDCIRFNNQDYIIEEVL